MDNLNSLIGRALSKTRHAKTEEEKAIWREATNCLNSARILRDLSPDYESLAKIMYTTGRLKIVLVDPSIDDGNLVPDEMKPVFMPRQEPGRPQRPRGTNPVRRMLDKIADTFHSMTDRLDALVDRAARFRVSKSAVTRQIYKLAGINPDNGEIVDPSVSGLNQAVGMMMRWSKSLPAEKRGDVKFILAHLNASRQFLEMGMQTIAQFLISKAAEKMFAMEEETRAKAGLPPANRDPQVKYEPFTDDNGNRNLRQIRR